MVGRLDIVVSIEVGPWMSLPRGGGGGRCCMRTGPACVHRWGQGDLAGCARISGNSRRWGQLGRMQLRLLGPGFCGA